MKCLAYKLYELLFKRNPVASHLFYGGQRFRHYGPKTISGTVIDCLHKATDGDRCFDVWTEDCLTPDGGHRWHCEITCCSPKEAKQFVAELERNIRVMVSGVRTFDPPHHLGPVKFDGGGWEIHPVWWVQKLPEVKHETSST